MRRAVITTTIYRPDNLLEWAACLRPCDLIVVSGDMKTPHRDVERVLEDTSAKFGIETHYLPDSAHYRTGEAVGWNSIQRRNVATLAAIEAGAEMITTVDTDNFPLSYDYVNHVERIFAEPWTRPRVCGGNGWFDVGRTLTPPVTHRGFPLDVDRVAPSAQCDGDTVPQLVGVHASLWSGDPDISALERLYRDPLVTHVPDETLALCTNTWCPFNSQATTYRRELLPLMLVWPGVGRMDDIWPSYVARYVLTHLGYITTYGGPNVRQERHAHDVVTDLENEIVGYRHTRTLLDVLLAVDLGGVTTALDALLVIFGQLGVDARLEDIIPRSTRDVWSTWCRDLRDIEETTK